MRILYTIYVYSAAGRAIFSADAVRRARGGLASLGMPSHIANVRSISVLAIGLASLGSPSHIANVRCISVLPCTRLT